MRKTKFNTKQTAKLRRTRNLGKTKSNLENPKAKHEVSNLTRWTERTERTERTKINKYACRSRKTKLRKRFTQPLSQPLGGRNRMRFKETHKGRTWSPHNTDANRKTSGCGCRRLIARTIFEEEGLLAGQPAQDPVDLKTNDKHRCRKYF